MELIGLCPETAVFHSACLLAEQVSAVDSTVLIWKVCFILTMSND